MKLLRHIKTLEYFAHGVWTADPLVAQVFPDIRSATATCLEHGLENVELITQFDFEQSEFEVPEMPRANP
jgi:hypothetical protein